MTDVVTLPTTPPPADFSLGLKTNQLDLRSATGGNLQRVQRMGSHYEVEVRLPRMTAKDARAWLGLRAEGSLVRYAIQQPDMVIGNPGTPTVNGTGQAGSSLAIKGMTPGYVIQLGQAFNHTGSDGRVRLYVAKAQVVVGGAGTVIVPLETMLLWPPLNNDVVSFTNVVIEGFANVSPHLWGADVAQHVGLEFSIEETG